MTSKTGYHLPYFQSLRKLASNHNCRFGVVLHDNDIWNRDVCRHWLLSSSDGTVFQLGGKAFDSVTYVPFNKGQQLLGRECNLLLCDLSDGWDANSFSAALGTLVGGGIVVIHGVGTLTKNPAQQWLQRALDELILLSSSALPQLPKIDGAIVPIDLSQQQSAIDSVVRVVEGHRKRPLVLTADRGRGKSSALGLAAARLMQSRALDIIVTAPNISSVAPVFQFAQDKLDKIESQRGLLRTTQSSLRFMAPDEILRSRPECDLLLVDEAAALPLPMLKSFVARYHRVVFSSTIHGYEGCGRGFTLKFQSWLKSVRPEMRSQNIEQPIRWALGDPLEAWHRRCFLLDFEFESMTEHISLDSLSFQFVDKSQLLASPLLLHRIFSLLVNAHYQTSPNDLFHLLGDEKMGVYTAMYGDEVVGCILSVQEGDLDASLILAIQQGKRRPRGHLAPVTLANQLGIGEAAQQSSLRIMRIAVHPDLQGQNIGSQLIERFAASQTSDYLSTSFGATSSLVQFWQACGFYPVKIGSQRDQASGCYSLLMVRGQQLLWLNRAKNQFHQHFVHELSDSLRGMETNLIKSLLISHPYELPSAQCVELVTQYALGGSNYESVAVWFHEVLISLPNTLISQVPDLLIAKILQRLSWQECANRFELTGRKQVETELRQQLNVLLTDLHCKTEA